MSSDFQYREVIDENETIWWSAVMGFTNACACRNPTNHFGLDFDDGMYLSAIACNCPGTSRDMSWHEVMVRVRVSKRFAGMDSLPLTAFLNRFEDMVFTSVNTAISDSTWMRCPLHSSRAARVGGAHGSWDFRMTSWWNNAFQCYGWVMGSFNHKTKMNKILISI